MFVVQNVVLSCFYAELVILAVEIITSYIFSVFAFFITIRLCG